METASNLLMQKLIFGGLQKHQLTQFPSQLQIIVVKGPVIKVVVLKSPNVTGCFYEVMFLEKKKVKEVHIDWINQFCICNFSLVWTRCSNSKNC